MADLQEVDDAWASQEEDERTEDADSEDCSSGSHPEEGGEADMGADSAGIYSATEVNVEVFEELSLPASLVEEVQGAWAVFLRGAESREAAGEAIYSAIFDSAPSLQSLFKTPRAVMAMRFMNGLNQIISQLANPGALKTLVETLGFQHLHLEVTVPRVVMFRDAIVDLLQMELGSQLSVSAHAGWDAMLNYVGGAYIYVRVKYTDRLKILASSWATANKKEYTVATTDEDEEAGSKETDIAFQSAEDIRAEEKAKMEAANEKQVNVQKTKRNKRGSGWFFSRDASSHDVTTGHGKRKELDDSDGNSLRNTSVPTTYRDMFTFNAAVMGFGQSAWMNEVLSSFDTIVTNVSNSYRLQEECDVLSLRLAKYKGTVDLPEYKAVMLASLRSLVPKDWNSEHEVAWSWLWENVERMLRSMMGKPANMERCLGRLWASLDEAGQATVRREVYAKFFHLAPSGQDFFKQSTTRLHFIADRIVSMTLEVYRDPKKMVEDISALGLRHVGYGIPTELFGPFVTACVQVVRGLTDDDGAEEAFRWSLNLISRILTRVITEGSTIVMKAINVNSAAQLRKAVGCAPRGMRAAWVLSIQVGTQSISPLLWAVETGSLEAAGAMIEDLLTIRADRDRYYYGMDALFERHGDIVRRLCAEAPALLPTLLDGLVWRSRLTENGTRRVNYLMHLVVDSSGGFSQAVEWISGNGDPKLVSHPIVAMVTDTVWSRIASRTFLINKSWMLFTMCVFVLGAGGLKHSSNGDMGETRRIVVAACRSFIYVLSLGKFLYHHVGNICRDVRDNRIIRIGQVRVPAYLENYQDCISLLLTMLLLAMLALEPVLICMPHWDEEFVGSGLFTDKCPQVKHIHATYSQLSALATMMFFALIVDLSVFSTRVSAFVLVGHRVLSEVFLFIVGWAFVILMSSCAISALDHDNSNFDGIPSSAIALLKITLRMYDGGEYQELHQEPALVFAVVVYVIVSGVFLLNLLIAQLSCSYQAMFQDMLGYARLNRGKIVVEAMAVVTEIRWRTFVDSLHLEERCEFGEGDIGLAGGIQVREPANANVTTVDTIRRFGGSTSPKAQWPEDGQKANTDEERFERMEKLIAKAMKRISRRHDGSSDGGSGAQSGMLSTLMSGSSSSDQASDHGSQ
ncbi:unnamed protein product [Prorocentrum cordatum]|uniref:Globin domain-containing protein n=1 Tax=Prorocentrum cordatum TaxID=2364126 RepID=A0ABN9RU83_9DINO|nr:unnamed protein product [Polarella glacialis]